MKSKIKKLRFKKSLNKLKNEILIEKHSDNDNNLIKLLKDKFTLDTEVTRMIIQQLINTENLILDI